MFPTIFAHRGASLLAPENTMPAFEKAIQLGADAIELDVQLSSDGELVVIHDEHLNRTTNLSGIVKNQTYDTLKNCEAGKWFSEEFTGVGIPHLKEVLALIAPTTLILNVELKSGIILYPEIEKKTIDLIFEYDMASRTIISSFNHYSLVLCRKLSRNIDTAPLYMSGLVEPWEYAKKIDAKYIHPLYFNILNSTQNQREALYESGIKANVFTPDSETEWKALIHLGVNGIITNDVEKITVLRDHIGE